jgi:hypothetical protein
VTEFGVATVPGRRLSNPEPADLGCAVAVSDLCPAAVDEQLDARDETRLV